MNSNLKVGDKVTLPANYRGEAIPVTEWTLYKSFKVYGMINAGLPNWRSLNLYLNKTSGRITA